MKKENHYIIYNINRCKGTPPSLKKKIKISICQQIKNNLCRRFKFDLKKIAICEKKPQHITKKKCLIILYHHLLRNQTQRVI